MTERDEFLMMAGYTQGFLNAEAMTADGASLIGSMEDEAERWLNETVADNGGTIGQLIAFDAPIA